MSFAIQVPQSTQVGAVYTPYTPTPAQSASLPIPDAKTAYEGFLNLRAQMPVEQRAALDESLATRLADETGISMYGREIKDTIHPEQHTHAKLEVNPYSHVGAGATIAVTATDPTSGELYILMARKHKVEGHPELGLGDYILPGGYMEAHPLAHGDPTRPFDRTLEDTARRELKEETGLTIPSHIPYTSLGADSRYGISNDPRLHTINEFFHVHLNTPLPPPIAGDDVAEVTWVNAKQILKDDTIGVRPFGSPDSRYKLATSEGEFNIRDEHGEFLEKALLRAKEQSTNPPMKQWVDRISTPGKGITFNR